MNLLFDGIATQGSKFAPYHGGADYAIFVLGKALEAGYQFDVLLYRDYVTNEIVLNLVEKYRVHTIFVNDEHEIYELLDGGKYDRFFSALPFLKKPVNTETIKVIHGLRGIECPWDEYRYKYEKSLLPKCLCYLISKIIFLQNFVKRLYVKKFNNLIDEKSTILTVSNHTLCSIRYYFPEKDLKRMVSIPAPLNLTKYEKSENSYGKYYLIVNGNRFEKNSYRAIQAFNELFDKELINDVKVVITGGSRMAFSSKIKHLDKYVLLDYVDINELHSLYSNAFALVYPSLQEGYGYPPLIAMANDVPVAASSAAAIPNTCKGGAIYFNPYNVDEIANRIYQLYVSKDLRDDLILAGREVVKKIVQSQDANTDKILKTIFGECSSS